MAKIGMQAGVDDVPHPGQRLGLAARVELAAGATLRVEFFDGGPEGIDALPTTQLWKEKIEPVLEANEGKRHRKPNVSNPSVNLKNAAATIN